MCRPRLRPQPQRHCPYLQGDAVIGEQLEAAAVVEAIHASSGLAVLAHPARYRLGFKP